MKINQIRLRKMEIKMKKFFLTIYLLLFSFVFTQETIINKFVFEFEPDSIFLRVGDTGSVTF